LYFDILSFLFVLSGAFGFLVMGNNSENHIANFGEGAVYFGWLGTIVGLIVITGDRFLFWGDIEKMGPALAAAMLTIFYGYTIKIVCIAFTEK
jgi:flagellar motor component MotA